MAQSTLQTAQLSSRELCRLGQEIYEHRLKQQLEPTHNGEHVVIHVVNGDYAVDPDEYRAFSTMRGRYPADAFYFARVGSDSGQDVPAPRSS